MASNRFFNFLVRLLGNKETRTTSLRPADVHTQPTEPVYLKVALLILDPIMASEGGVRMTHVFNWNDPNWLVSQLVADLKYASYGYANYQIVETIIVNDFVPLADGFRYTSNDFIHCWQTQSGFHKPEEVDLHWLIRQYRLDEKVQSGEIDEVWTVGYPYAGFYESRMVGPSAFWCNAPPLEGYANLSRRFIIMAFNFERGVGEMLESYGHRAESIMSYVFKDVPEQDNLWAQFTRTEYTHPGRAEVGTIHFAPNSTRDYDWGNLTQVVSRSQAWLSYPDLSVPPRREDASAWGNGGIREHHLWWYRHLPHAAGSHAGIDNNWWKFIVNPNLV